MNQSQRVSLFLLRIGLGWFFLYAGITKILSGSFTALGYLSHAKLLGGFYTALTASSVLPYVNFANEWALTLLGVSLILGLFVRFSAPLGIILMVLYYIPLGVIHPDANSMIVDEHIIIILSLCVLAAFRSGRIWGLDGMRNKNR